MNPAKYLGIAYEIARLSKDPSTKVGALILGEGSSEIRATGYNGAPRSCMADEDHRFADRDEKLFWVSHAEINAICNAARIGTPLGGSTLIVTHPPCMDCAKAIVQAGIKRVCFPYPMTEFQIRWQEHYERALALFRECGVEVITL